MRAICFMVILILLCAAAPYSEEKGAPVAIQISVDKIIERFTTAETANKEEKKHFNFKQDYEVLEIGETD